MQHCVLQTPTLQHLAGVKIVTYLWSQRDITSNIAQKFDRQVFKEIEYEVKEKISAFTLPHQCRKQLINIIKPIGMEIIHWCLYNNYSEGGGFKFLASFLLNQLCWTMHGTLDYKQMAAVMVKDQRIDVHTRYIVACLNCLEDDARQLIEFIHDERRQQYIEKALENVTTKPCVLIGYFTCTLSGKTDYLIQHFETMLAPGCSVNKCLFAVMLRSGNGASCEYFYEKLTEREKGQFLSNDPTQFFYHSRNWPSCKVLYYLSLMDEEHQKLILFKCDRVFSCLLSWPFQPLLMQVAKCGWQFICRDNIRCGKVLTEILVKVIRRFQDYDYALLFWECWWLSSEKCRKKLFADETFVEDLLVTRREEFVRFVFNDAPSRVIKRLCRRFVRMRKVLADENVISDAALKACAEDAALRSANDVENEEKKLRSEHLTRLVDIVLDCRIKRKQKV